jgi:uncharacterized protein
MTIELSSLILLSRWCFVAVLLGVPFGLYAAINLPTGSAGVHEWLPEGREERLRYERFSKEFGSDQVILLSWDGCHLDDPRLRSFSESLQADPEYATWFTKIGSPQTLIASLQQSPSPMSQEDAIKRLAGVLIGNGRTCSLALSVTSKGVLRHSSVIELLRKTADRVENLGRQQLRMVGSVYESYSVDEAAEASLRKLVLPSTFLGLAISWLCLRSLKGALLVLTLASLGQLIAIAMVFYTGYQFSAVLIVLPTLVFMLTLSGAVHLVNYYFDDASDSRWKSVPSRGLRAMLLGWKPCALSSITTMLGMGSLCLSQLAPVRQFGLFSAGALGLATLLLLLLFPFVSDLVLGSNQRRDSSGWLSSLAYLGWLKRNCRTISVISFGLLALTFVGLSMLHSSTKFCEMFSDSSATNRDMKWFEQNIGPIATVEVLLRFRNASGASTMDQLQWTERVSDRLRTNSSVGGVFSAASILPSTATGRSVRAAATRAVYAKRVDENIDSLKEQGLVYENEVERVWRVMAKVSATSDQSYGEMTQSIRKTVADLRQKPSAYVLIEPDEIEFTGLAPVMHDTQMALLSDLGTSFLSAFVLITPVMMWIVRSFLGGLLIMLPNVLPVTLAFGTMGWMGWSLDIAGILTASIALGIAVDDTLHFSSWYMEECNQGRERWEAIQRTFASCATAMFNTTMISCSAMLPFLFAEFIPTGQFAKLMVVMLSGAIVGDLLVLPALLLSPLGKTITGKTTS